MATPITVEPVLCLASASPRRVELLEQIGVRFVQAIPVIDEAAISASDVRARILAVARAKAAAVDYATDNLPVLAADTAVVCGNIELGKPSDRDQAMAMLAMLSARAHWVYTAVVVRHGERYHEAIGATKVWFTSITAPDIARYCDTPEPYDKAGAYGIQGRAAIFISRIEGSYSNVVGLPLFETAVLLEQTGIRL
jgi:septum formation protein